MPISSLFDQVGPLARTVRDLALFDSVAAGDSSAFAAKPLRGVRLGVVRDYWFVDLHPEVEKIAGDALARLRDAGAVLVEGTMVKGWDYMRGMPPGGTLVINTHYTPEYMVRFVPGADRLAQLVCVDAAKLADHKWLYYRLGQLGLDRLSTEGAAERGKAIAPDIAAPLIAAVVKTTGIVKMSTIQPMIANQKAFEMALNELHVLPLKPVAA